MKNIIYFNNFCGGTRYPAADGVGLSRPRRRVVLAADVPEDQVGRDGGFGGSFEEPTRVVLSAAVPLARVVSGHVDDLLAMPDVSAAVAALGAAEAGDDDAQFLVDGAEGHELMWYATQELPFVAGNAS